VRKVTEALLHVLASGQRAALATVTRVSGSTPQRAGARLLLLPDDSTLGTVGGGAIEQEVLQALQQVRRTGEPQLLTRALGYDLGMCCGGRMEVFIEPIVGAPRLVLFGAGHVAKPTAALARSIGFEVTVVDEREELATAERFPNCQIELTDPESYLRRSQLHALDWLVIMTHDHQLDERLLGLAFAQPVRYIGMIGSKRKVYRLLTRCAEKGIAVDLSRMFAPIGLDLGALGPEEIAVSIAAELVALRRGGHVQHMRASEDPALQAALTAPQPPAAQPIGATHEAQNGAPPVGGRAVSHAAAHDPREPAQQSAAPSVDAGAASQVAAHNTREPARQNGAPSFDAGVARQSAALASAAQQDVLGAHSARVRADLARLDYPRREWLTPRTAAGGEPIYDVIIVGAGQGGLATAFALQRERVSNVLVVDDNPLDRAGPWLNFARMHTLRTPKHVTGPDLGIPSLTFQAWYEAQHGADAWRTLGLIPKEQWATYLGWYRRTLDLPVLADTRVGALRWDADIQAFRVPCSSTSALTQPRRAGTDWTLLARRVVLATGIDGSGHWHVPSMITGALPRERYAHTRDAIDFAALRGKRVAVLGAGASAFDNAAAALDQGAAEVRLYFRRSELVSVNPYRWAESSGFLRHLGDLPDADKWRFISQIMRMGQLPPRDTLQRAQTHAGFHLQPNSAWHKVEERAGAIAIHTSSGTYEADFIIAGTGFTTDLRARPELALLEPQIARWADRFTPPTTDSPQSHDDLLRHPYLGPCFELTERVAGAAPELKYLYNYTFGCLLSLGFGGASISGMKYSIPRLVSGITSSLFQEDRAAHYQSLRGFDEREF
jgi:xanthine/CO dehydrogenase XdhC/CoxF family maturation factor/cation diffusion facilitator CzcD-associated flavoprotein CzcO